MSIIVPTNHTRIGAWVNIKMSGRNPQVYCTIPLIAMQGYHKTLGAIIVVCSGGAVSENSCSRQVFFRGRSPFAASV